jgi:hypothetical protein
MTKKEIELVANEFDSNNSDNQIPNLSEFIAAFKQFSGKKTFDIEILFNAVLFKTKEGEEYLVHTYEGLTNELEMYYINNDYEDIYINTELSLWSEIYVDAGIDKTEFIPILLHRWEAYWNAFSDKFSKHKTLEKLKETSWREFQLFVNLYEGDIIKLAYNINDSKLYPMVVCTMLDIFDKDVCFSEYCEFEFFTPTCYNYTSVEIDNPNATDDDDVDDESLFFFVRKYE